MHEQSEMLTEDQMAGEQSKSSKLTYWFLYLNQGGVIALASTTPYLYSTVPGYNIMAVFAAASLPYSFNRFVAPFIEKFTSMSYGKKRTWVCLGVSLSGLFVLLSSFFFNPQGNQNLIVALLLFFATLSICCQDIALDSLVIKQLKSADQTAFIQSLGKSIGYIFISTTLLKLTSYEFADWIGLSAPVTSVTIFFRVFAFQLLLGAVWAHFYLSETHLENDHETVDQDFCDLLSRYKIFIRPQSRHFRLCLFYLISNQGINVFACAYDYECVQRGISRNQMNTLANVTIITTTIFACLFQSTIVKLGPFLGYQCLIGLKIILIGIAVINFPVRLWQVWLISAIFDALSIWDSILCLTLNNSFPLSPVTGMHLTMLASAKNFGSECAPHMSLIGRFGYLKLARIGLAFQAVFWCTLPLWRTWIENGKIQEDIDAYELDEEPDQQIEVVHSIEAEQIFIQQQSVQK